MNPPSTRFATPRVPATLGRPVLAVTLLVLLAGAARQLSAQSFDFNNGNDAGWTRYALPAYGAPTFSFPADDSGGKAYRISAPPTGADPFGLRNARAGSFRAEVQYTGRFVAGVDLLAWNAAWRQEAGMLFYLSQPGLGTSDGYSTTYSSAYRNLYISSILNETPTTVGTLGDGSTTLDPAHRYRLVASTHDGYTLLAQLFDKAEPANPWVSAIGLDFAASTAAGFCGLFVFQQTYPSTTEGAEATFDNYSASVPAAGTLPATVTDLSPPPAGKATALYPTLSVNILDRDTQVDPASIVLQMDGTWIPNSALTIEYAVSKPSNPVAYSRTFSGAMASYVIPTLFPWGSKHTNVVAFADYGGVWRTNTWTWTSAYPYLFASNSLPLGSLNVRGFDTRMAQSDNGGVNLDNSLARALQQLAIPPAIPINRAATGLVQTLNWNKASAPPGNVPGLCAGAFINIAVESTAYLELSAGVHRFHIQTDDRAGVYSGASLADPAATIVWESATATANTNFDFVVEAPGLYPMRVLWEETGGSAVLALRSVDLNDQSEVLINDPANPAGVVRTWYPLVCRSAAAVAGPYTVETAAVNAPVTVNLVGGDCSPTVVGQMVTSGAFTVPLSGATRFYRLDGPRKTRITNVVRSGANLVLTYQVL